MSDWSECTIILATSLSCFELILNEEGEELLCFDTSEFDRAFDFDVHEKLLFEEVWKGCEEGVAPRAQQLLDVLIIGQSALKFLIGLLCLCNSKELVELNDKLFAS